MAAGDKLLLLKGSLDNLELDSVTEEVLLLEAGGVGSQTADIDFISSGSSTFEPTVTVGAVTKAADFIPSGSATYEPTASPGSVARTADYIGSGSATYEPTVTSGAITAQADYIPSGSATYEPTATPGSVTRTADFISSGSSVFEPTASIQLEGQIDADFIPSGSAVYEPTATPGSVTRTADYIGSGSATYEPTASSTYTATVDYIGSGSATYEPTASPGAVTASIDYIASGSLLYEPTITGGVPVVEAPTGGGWLFDKKKTKKRYDLFKKSREKDAEADAEFMRMLLGERLQEGEALVVKNVQRDNKKKVLIKLDVESDIKKLAPKIRELVPFPVMIQTLPRKVKKKRVITIDIIKQDDEQIFRMLEKLL